MDVLGVEVGRSGSWKEWKLEGVEVGRSGSWKEKRKTKTEMGGLCEERFGESGVENESEG